MAELSINKTREKKNAGKSKQNPSAAFWREFKLMTGAKKLDFEFCIRTAETLSEERMDHIASAKWYLKALDYTDNGVANRTMAKAAEELYLHSFDFASLIKGKNLYSSIDGAFRKWTHAWFRSGKAAKISGELYRQVGMSQEALESFERAVAMLSNARDSYYSAGNEKMAKEAERLVGECELMLKEKKVHVMVKTPQAKQEAGVSLPHS